MSVLKDRPPSDDARLTDSAKGTALGSATTSSADVSPVQAEQEDRCVAEEWHRDGRGLWAMRRCTLPPKHSEGHTYLAWRYRVDPPSFGAQAEQEIATLKANIAAVDASRDRMKARAEEAEQARAALRALVVQLISKWRETADWLDEHGECRKADSIFACADELDAVLRSPVERTRDEENDLTRQSSASEAPDLGISAIPTRKAPGDD